MVDLVKLSRRWLALGACLVFVSASVAQPVALSPRWQAIFPAVGNGHAADTTAVPVAGGTPTMVVVVAAGSDLKNLKIQLGNRPIPFKVIGLDPVSRLGFISVEGGVQPKTTAWVDDAGPSANAILHSMEPGGPIKCRTMGWVKQVGGKILPLALLRVKFSREVPPPGTPLVDDAGRVVGIVFQRSGNGNTGYAIPAEAVHRVQQDICNGGRLTRGWLGLALRAESQMPEISRVLPNSPAAAAGIKASDMLLSIGLRPVTDYADAANAFFYLIPGQPVRVKLLRDADQLEFTLTPTQPKG